MKNDGIRNSRAGGAGGGERAHPAVLCPDRAAAAERHDRSRLPPVRGAGGRPAAADPVLSGAGRAAERDRPHRAGGRFRPAARTGKPFVGPVCTADIFYIIRFFKYKKNNPDKQEIFLEFRDYSIILCLFLFQSYDRE